MKTLQGLVKKNKELFWDVWDISKMDNMVIEERFIKYGNWENIKSINKILWEEAKINYIKIRDKKKSDLSKKTINFFNLYYNV
jgi:hypothetical protein